MDVVNLWVVRHIRETDIRRGFVSKPLLDIGGIFQTIVRIDSGHEPRARQGEGNAGGINCYPPSAPLFCDVGGGAAAARRIEDKITRVACHQNASLDDFRLRLNDIGFPRASSRGIRPKVRKRAAG